MDKLIAIACFITGLAYVVFAGADGGIAVVLVLVLSGALIFAFRVWFRDSSADLIRIFSIALLARLMFGLLLEVFDLRAYFGGDSITYDAGGDLLAASWIGTIDSEFDRAFLSNRLQSVGWGMYYLVAAIYSATGRNPLAAQAFCGFIGAMTAPIIFLGSTGIYSNRRVGLISGYLVALFPAMIVWSGQLLKDGLVIFFLVLSITLASRLKQKFSSSSLILLLISLFGIYALRSYIFYMVAIAVVGMLVVRLGSSFRELATRVVLLALVGLAATYFVRVPTSNVDLQRYTNLEQIQLSRQDLSRAGSGFGEDIDVSTTQGAIQALPVGLVYLLLAPFPWQITSPRAAAALPDMLIWWISIPFLISGLIYTFRNRLSEALGILIFTGMLTLAYSVFQGNVGTAYRQRTQIQVFMFIFVAVGITVFLERRENAKELRRARAREFDRRYRERDQFPLHGA